MPEAAPAQADHNLAEMAQQLEAALRRAPAPEGRPPVTDPLASQLSGHVTARPARDLRARVEPKFEAKPESKFEPRTEPKAEHRTESKGEPKAEPKFDSKPELREPAATPGKNLYENLEEEMANLLGRPPGKT
jgi:hypothetical protein